MIAPKQPSNEKERQLEVEKYQILDTLPQESYDSITAVMAYICDTPISLVTILDGDRNFLKSHHGVPFNESPRDISFCGHAINSQHPITIVEDSRKDERFHDNPLVTEHHAIFYAGATLTSPNGYKLGTLCVYDTKPRRLTDKQLDALTALSKQVTYLLEQRFQNIKLNEVKEKLKSRNDDLKKFANVVSHDLKSPLANIISLTQLLEDENKETLSENSILYLKYLSSSSNSLKNYIDGVLKFFKSDISIKDRKEKIKISEFIDEIKKLTDPEQKVHFEIENQVKMITTNKSALTQIFNNLITNAIKYNSKPNKQIHIKISENNTDYELSVTDNGDGIPEEHLSKVFDLFSIVGVLDNEGNIGTGLGLSTVKKIINRLDGEVKVTSKLGEGSTFNFSISKIE
ncbi:MAG: sensor histidine kinase [Flavobacteriaceae bacterium]